MTEQTDEERLEFLFAPNPSPLSQSAWQRFQVPLKEVVGSQLSLPAAAAESAPFTQNPFQRKEPGNGQLIDNASSVAPASGVDGATSRFSRNDTEYHDVVLTWTRLWPRETADLVVHRVRQLTGCISVAVYLSRALNRTLAQICFDASRPGFRRDFFTHGQKRKGANLLIKCEVPVPWSKFLSYDRKKQLGDFFADCPDLQTIGDDGDATFPYKEWQDTKHERMRDKKNRYKRDQQMLSK